MSEEIQNFQKHVTTKYSLPVDFSFPAHQELFDPDLESAHVHAKSNETEAEVVVLLEAGLSLPVLVAI